VHPAQIRELRGNLPLNLSNTGHFSAIINQLRGILCVRGRENIFNAMESRIV
jgi:hypothetical protein